MGAAASPRRSCCPSSLHLFFQICSQLSERLEKQQAANRGELEKIRVKVTLTHSEKVVEAVEVKLVEVEVEA